MFSTEALRAKRKRSGSTIRASRENSPALSRAVEAVVEPLEKRVLLSASASLIKIDTTTSGNWTGVYGADGYSVVGGATTLPGYGTFSVTGDTFYQWQGPGTDNIAPPTDSRDLYVRAGDTNRIAACDYGDTISYNVAITDGNVHQVSLYMMDWDSLGRSQTVTVSDPTTGAVLATNDVSNFSGGDYLVYNISGAVTIASAPTQGATTQRPAGSFSIPDPAPPGRPAPRQGTRR